MPKSISSTATKTATDGVTRKQVGNGGSASSRAGMKRWWGWMSGIVRATIACWISTATW
jgi:hypothetical protein